MKSFDLGYAIGRIVRYILSKTVGVADDDFMNGFTTAMEAEESPSYAEAVNNAKDIALAYAKDPEVQTIISETADIMVTEDGENMWDDIQSWLNEVGAIWKQWKQSRKAKREARREERKNSD